MTGQTQNPQPAYALRVTARCLVDDLDFGPPDLERPLAELARENTVLSAFLEKRSQLPVDQDRIRGLTASIVAYSLHAGAHRGLTWHDEHNGVVWLLASRFHRSGKRGDSYPYFRAIHREDLLPTHEDYRRHFHDEAYTFAKALMIEPAALLREARQRPGQICTGRIANRIEVRLAIHRGDPPPLLTVALSQRLRPGEPTLPGDWMMHVAAAFFSDTQFEHLALVDDLAGESLRADELAFCDFFEYD